MKLLSLVFFALLGFAAAEEAAVEVEEVVAPADTFTEEERATLDSTQETHEFKAEVSRLMDIIINSLYSNRDIFLREMISNSADALDKARFLSLTNPDIMADKEELEIRIKVDSEARTISLTDSGVGMTKADLQSHLGIVAKSGTTEFLEKAQSTDDSLGLIGQFGVGFYSVYLVADKVTVISKNHDDEQYIWESTAKADYTIAKDPRGNTLGRGTQIVLHLKDDAEEFLDTKSIEGIITRYSQFINFPIHLHQIEEVEKQVPVEKEEKEKKEAAEGEEEEDIEVFEEEDEAEEEEEMETIIEEVESWKRVNDAQPLWTKDPKEVTEAEYEEFYKALTKDTEGPLETIHFVAEGEISFRALLFIPKAMDRQVYENYYQKQSNLKLYVRRVLISDEFDDFLPQYMGFVKGVVDSDDLPLNVSRETLAQSKVLQVIAKKLKRKVLESLRKIAERSRAEEEDEDEDNEESSSEESEGDKEAPADDYKSFWENYGKSVKMGIMNDNKAKSKLVKLIRFQTTKSKGELTSFEDYVDRMGEDQKKIWFLTHENSEKAKAHPALEGFARRDIEVILFSEPLDEYFMAHIHEVDGVEPSNIAKQQSDAPWKVSKAYEADKAEAEVVCEWMKTVLGDSVKEVSHSAKLIASPAVITATQFGNTANMERVQAAQSLSDSVAGPPEKNMEINWRHPIVKEIGKRASEDTEDETAKEMTWMLFQSAQIYSGYMLHETEDFAARINRVVAKGLGVDPDAKADVEEEEEEEEVAEEEQAEEVEAEEVEAEQA